MWASCYIGPRYNGTRLYMWYSLVTGELPSQRSSHAVNVSIWWRHHDWGDHSLLQCQWSNLKNIPFILKKKSSLVAPEVVKMTSKQYWVYNGALAQWRPNIPSQRSVTWSLDGFFDLHRNKRLSKQSRYRWFETPSHPLWRHCNVWGNPRGYG